MWCELELELYMALMLAVDSRRPCNTANIIVGCCLCNNMLGGHIKMCCWVSWIASLLSIQSRTQPILESINECAFVLYLARSKFSSRVNFRSFWLRIKPCLTYSWLRFLVDEFLVNQNSADLIRVMKEYYISTVFWYGNRSYFYSSSLQ